MGLARKIGRGLAYLTALDAWGPIARETIGYVGRTSKAVGDAMTGVGRQLLRGPDRTPLPNASDDKEVRFQQAVKHFRYRRDDLEKCLFESNMAFWTYVVAAVVWVGFAVASYRYGGSSDAKLPIWVMSIQTEIARWLFALVLPLLAFKNGLMNWQIRRRRLGDWREYLKSGDILPHSKFR